MGHYFDIRRMMLICYESIKKDQNNFEYNGTEYTKGSVCFEIYADDKLVYSFSPINDATRALEFEVPIEDCHKLRIVWKHSGNNERASIIFSDAKVYRK